MSTNSFLGALTAVCGSPSFEFAGSAATLSQATAEFVAWLNQKANVDIWLSSIGAEGELQILRLDFLKMCGDISEHNFLRSVSVAAPLVIDTWQFAPRSELARSRPIATNSLGNV